ncbi:MAG: energy transducer TonB [Myxococcales bacterium]|nr:energy transducer TonB [Myxococcales bacterium]
MFGGFDPSGNADGAFFERKRWQSLLGALLLVGGSLGYAFYMASLEPDLPEQEEIVDAEIQTLEMEEEPEEEEEIEEEPEPPPPEPPPSSEPVKRNDKPTPQPEIQNPDSVDENPEEGQVNDQGPGYGEGGSGNGGGNGKKSDGEDKPEPKPATEDKPKPKPKSEGLNINPDKPIDRPAEATVPKQVGGNSPVYPDALKKRNITGKVKVRLVIYKDGTVKGAKVLAKENSLDKNADPELYEKANKLLLKAVADAVKTWTFKPSTYKGKPITVYLTVTIPFTLN